MPRKTMEVPFFVSFVLILYCRSSISCLYFGHRWTVLDIEISMNWQCECGKVKGHVKPWKHDRYCKKQTESSRKCRVFDEVVGRCEVLTVFMKCWQNLILWVGLAPEQQSSCGQDRPNQWLTAWSLHRFTSHTDRSHRRTHANCADRSCSWTWLQPVVSRCHVWTHSSLTILSSNVNHCVYACMSYYDLIW